MDQWANTSRFMTLTEIKSENLIILKINKVGERITLIPTIGGVLGLGVHRDTRLGGVWWTPKWCKPLKLMVLSRMRGMPHPPRPLIIEDNQPENHTMTKLNVPQADDLSLITLSDPRPDTWDAVELTAPTDPATIAQLILDYAIRRCLPPSMVEVSILWPEVPNQAGNQDTTGELPVFLKPQAD